MSPEQGLTPHVQNFQPPAKGMRYFEEMLDRKTGELVSVDKGDWITIAELAELMGVGRRQATTFLKEMNFLHIHGVGRDSRHRIASWVSENGWGRTNRRKTDKYPFDVISHEAVQWITQKWQDAVSSVEERTKTEPVVKALHALEDFKVSRDRQKMGVLEQAYWLADHFPDLTHQHMADVLDVTRQLIDRYMKARQKQRQKCLELKASYR
jgi:hypothetical protein